jgi:hypothetical protein
MLAGTPAVLSVLFGFSSVPPNHCVRVILGVNSDRNPEQVCSSSNAHDSILVGDID